MAKSSMTTQSKESYDIVIYFLFQFGANVMFSGRSLDLSRMLKERDFFFLVLIEVHLPSWQYVQQFVSVCLGGRRKKRVRCCIVLT